ncbi:hypothetical protein Pyn_40814 [Prunus yedoensis var. nudiflora]|uniref:Uncharacterized protein n=1 Tax=Prunus yedoensis var. nudiflora TaxID=2094558 RepID=A0A314UIH7_PRUYE|nr:hypothetical protein Pyn_40814 [Prunus yedoensis var. nudiflora]
MQAESATAEEEVLEPSRKRLLLVLSKGKDEEEVPPGTTTDAEVVAAEAPAAEAAVVEASDAEAAVAEPPLVAPAGSPSVLTIVPSLADTAPIEPSPIVPCRPSGNVIRCPDHPCPCPRPSSHRARQSPRSLCLCYKFLHPRTRWLWPSLR